MLEDAFIRHYALAIAGLFKPGGLLLVDSSPVDGASRLSAGSDQIRQTAATLCRQNFVYPAETRRIWQTGGIALLRAASAVNVAQRGRGSGWRYRTLHLYEHHEDQSDDSHHLSDARCKADSPPVKPPGGMASMKRSVRS